MGKKNAVVDVKAFHAKQTTGELFMNISEYQHWFDAIQQDNEPYVRQVLSSAGDQEKQRLLNGRFVYQESNHVHQVTKLLGKNNFKVTRPLILSALYSSGNVFACLLEFGASSGCLDDNGDNLVHSMILGAARCSESEEELVMSYKGYCRLIRTNDMITLLHTENAKGLRPLEFAANLGCCRMVKAIMETPGVYLVREEKSGMVYYQWIDITEYESTDKRLDRRGKSPLGFLTMMDETTLVKPGTKELFKWTPFKIWREAKRHPCKIFIILWFLLRMGQITTYFVLSVDKGVLNAIGGISDQALRDNESTNYTFVYCSGYASYTLSGNTRSFLLAYMSALNIALLMFDIVEVLVITIRKTPRYFCGYQAVRPDLVVTRCLYRFSQFCLSFIFGLLTTLQLIGGRLKVQPIIMQSINLVCMVNITLSVMFFCQMLPLVGIYVITVKRMLSDLVNFSFLYLLWVTPFSLYFMVFFNTGAKSECVSDFADVAQSFYSTFRMMVNMLDVTSYDVYNVRVVNLLHGVYVFTVYILLINFLIAVMSTSATRIALSEDIILQLERMHIVLTLEHRIGWLLPRFLQQYKSCIIVVEDNKYFLMNVEYK